MYLYGIPIRKARVTQPPTVIRLFGLALQHGCVFIGDVFMDGAFRMGAASDLWRAGWGVVCVDKFGKVTGVCYGTCSDELPTSLRGFKTIGPFRAGTGRWGELGLDGGKLLNQDFYGSSNTMMGVLRTPT